MRALEKGGAGAWHDERVEKQGRLRKTFKGQTQLFSPTGLANPLWF